MNFRKELRAGQGYTIRLDAGGRLEDGQGRILIVGGYGPASALASAELY